MRHDVLQAEEDGPGPSPDARAAALARTPLFSALDNPALHRLAGMARPIAVRADAAVFRKGDPSRSLYVIDQGRVKIATTSAEGREIVLNLLGPGAMFGEIALVDGGERTADAIATEPARLLALDRAELIPYLEANPRLMLHMLVVMAQRVRWVASSLEDTAFLSLPARAAKRLLLLAEQFGLETAEGLRLTVSLPQHEMARHLGVTRESVNRLFQDWLADGLIAIDRGVIVLRDLARLRAIVAGG
jgi:CRP/FNR family cyclic AMP-dependent transcriptional regulator